MYQYTEFDRQFVRARADQYRDQLERRLSGQLAEEEFRPLRLQNGWYVQRYAPMLRVAVPYGEISAPQLQVLAQIAREYDTPDAALLAEAQAQGFSHDYVEEISEPSYAGLMAGADALVICTEWKWFMAPNFDQLAAALRHKLIVDGRNLYDPKRLAELGWPYHAIGRGASASPVV